MRIIHVYLFYTFIFCPVLTSKIKKMIIHENHDSKKKKRIPGTVYLFLVIEIQAFYKKK